MTRREYPGPVTPPALLRVLMCSGHVHDLAADRENVLGALRPFLDAIPVLADAGYEGAGHGVHDPGRSRQGEVMDTIQARQGAAADGRCRANAASRY